jgi:glutamate-1-semialdehyde 2,1-aminomutase
MADQGVFLPPSQFEGLFLSTAHSDEDIEKTIQAATTAFSKLK